MVDTEVPDPETDLAVASGLTELLCASDSGVNAATTKTNSAAKAVEKDLI
jgi:hypothetical protein